MIDPESIISNQLLKENEAHERQRQIGEYYCTDLGNCIRKTWYKYQDLGDAIEEQDKEDKIRMLKVFERGNLLHEWITERIRSHVEDIGGTLREEVSVVIPNLKDQFVIRGRIDNLIGTKNGYEIIEVKTTARIKKRGMPQPHHVAQVMPYLLYSPNAKAGILYIEPATLKTAFYEVNYDVFAMQDLWGKANDLHHCLTNNIMPDAEAKLKKEENWQCKYCEYKVLCDEIPEIGKPQDFVPINGCKQEEDVDMMQELVDSASTEDTLESFADEVEQIDSDLQVAIQNDETTPPQEETMEEKWARLKGIMKEAEEEAEDVE